MIKLSIAQISVFIWRGIHIYKIDFGMQKTDKFINNDIAIQSEIRDRALL